MSLEDDLRKVMIEAQEDSLRAAGIKKWVLPTNFEPMVEGLLARIPKGSKVIMGFDGVILLDQGVLSYSVGFGGEIDFSELVSFKEISDVTLGTSGKNFTLLMQRTGSKVRNIGAISNSQEKAIKFKESLLSLSKGAQSAQVTGDGPLEKIAKLKKLLDSGAITQKEFNDKKKKFMDSL